jgi:alkylation response protein AidB-like acyl-CoA dehydrogenase
MQHEAPSTMDEKAPSAGPVERIGSIADVIEKSGGANEALGQLTPEVVEKLHEQRLFRLLLPRAYGGEEIDLVTWFRSMEALAKLDASTAWCVGQINGCAAASAAVEPEAARKIWGEPRSVLSWGPPLRSRAEEADGGHRLSGEWGMSSGSRHATWVGLMAPLFDRSGAPLPLPKGITTRIFLAPAGTVEWVDNWNVLGLRATNSGGFKVENLFVPLGFSLSREHLSEVRLPGPLYKFPLNALFGIGFSAVALGIARAMLDAVIAVAKEKRPWLAKTSLLENHLVQYQIGEAEARLRSARAYVEGTAGRVWQAVVSSGELTIPQRVDIRMAATFAIHEANAVANVAWEVAGATAIFAPGPFERRLRDIRTLTQQAQGRRSHLQDAGAYLLGLEPNLTYA